MRNLVSKVILAAACLVATAGLQLAAPPTSVADGLVIRSYGEGTTNGKVRSQENRGTKAETSGRGEDQSRARREADDLRRLVGERTRAGDKAGAAAAQARLDNLLKGSRQAQQSGRGGQTPQTQLPRTSQELAQERQERMAAERQARKERLEALRREWDEKQEAKFWKELEESQAKQEREKQEREEKLRARQQGSGQVSGSRSSFRWGGGSTSRSSSHGMGRSRTF